MVVLDSAHEAVDEPPRVRAPADPKKDLWLTTVDG